MKSQAGLKGLRLQTNKVIIVLMLALIGGVMTLGCAKKKNAPPPVYVPPPVNPTPGCAGCNGAGTEFLMSALGQSGSGTLELGLEFFGDASSAGSGVYSGQAFGVGTLFVDGAGGYQSPCSILPGRYEVHPYNGTPGQVSNKSIYNMYLEANGPMALIIALPSVYVLNTVGPTHGTDGNTYPFRLQGWIQILPGGNQQCGALPYAIY